MREGRGRLMRRWRNEKGSTMMVESLKSCGLARRWTTKCAGRSQCYICCYALMLSSMLPSMLFILSSLSLCVKENARNRSNHLHPATLTIIYTK